MINVNQKKYKANSDYILREIAGEYMLIPTGSLSMTANGMVTISESAAFLWRNLTDGKTSAELVELMLKEYEADEETVRKDIDELTESMCSIGAFIISDAEFS